jgi:hypothetical protein
MARDLAETLRAGREDLAGLRGELSAIKSLILKAAEWHEEDHPRASDGRFGDKPGVHGGAGGAAATAARPRTSKARAAKRVAKLDRFTNAAVRRKVLHGLRNEKQLSDAIDGHNLPDSEPADVAFGVTPEGELLTHPGATREFLARREAAVKLLRDVEAHGGARQFHSASALEAIRKAEEVVAAPLHFFEVKSLVTQKGAGAVHMSAKARRRKEAWEERYAAPFHTVAFDDRRGHKHSGHRLYYRRGVGSVRLSAMEKVADFDELMARAGG